jgi:serine phosphatase RsbU (regulator of sigma subunit)/signal transduction protein with GAF and PtsI domain
VSVHTLHLPAHQIGGPINGPFVLVYLLLGLALLAAVGAVLWRRHRSRLELEARLAELTQLADIGRCILDAPLDLAALAETIYRQAGKIGDANLFQLGLFEANRYRLLIWIVDGQARPPAEFRLAPESPGIVGWVRDHRQSLLVRDFEKELESLPALPPYPSSDPPRSGVFLPLIAADTVLGVMALQSRQAGAFDEEQLRRLTLVTNHAAAALRNARAFSQAARRAAQLELLAQVSQRINALQPLPSLYNDLVHLVAARFGEYLVSFFERDDDGLCLRATTRREWRGREITFSLGEGPVGHAAAAVEPVVLQDLPELGSETATGVTPLEGATLAVPVEIDGRVLGVLEVRSPEPVAFDEATVAVFTSLASQIAIAILEAQTYEAERRRSEQLSAIAEASRAVTSTLEMEDLLAQVLTLLAGREYFGYEQARIYLGHEGRLVCAASTRPEEVAQVEGWETAGLSYALDGAGLIPLVGRTRRQVLAADVTAHPDYCPDSNLERARAWMAAPMALGTHLVGVFEVFSEQPGAFGEPDLQTLQTLADGLAVAVRNVRLFEAERRRRRLAEILSEVSAALTSTLELDRLLELILDGLARVVQHDTASLLLADDRGNVRLLATRGSPAAQAALDKVFDVHLFPPGEEFPATIPFNEVDRWGEYHTLLALPEPHACLGALLAIQGRHMGYLAVDRAGQSLFVPEEIEVVAAFASQAAIAIENARLYTKEREQAWLSGALLQVSEATAHATDLAEVLAIVTRLIPELVGVDHCAVLLQTPAGDAFTIETGDGSGQAPSTTFEEFPPLYDVLDTLESVSVEAREMLPGSLQGLFTGQTLVMPLVSQEHAHGALAIGQAAGAAPLSPRQLELLRGIAYQAAVAVEAAHLAQEAAQQQRLDRELEVARDIQASFLPGQLPQPGGWQVSAFWQAARKVGGDFYDFFRLRAADSGERWGVVIADVADKGVPAALFMALSRTLLRTMGINLVSPAATLSRVNQLLQVDSRSQLFVTVFYAIWEPQAGRLRYAVGGHHPPIWLDSTGRFRPVPGRGAALGVYDLVEYEEHEIHAEAGDVLVLFTDGLLDAVDTDEAEFGMDRLLAVLRETHGCAPEAIQQAVVEAVRAHVGRVEAFDDITMIILKRTA